ncbi:MAG: hypothetical protein C5S52_00325 [ANME-2 cluster archaeon]|nr:hypothetical protein [ANME-2 cluster archaeon]
MLALNRLFINVAGLDRGDVLKLSNFPTLRHLPQPLDPRIPISRIPLPPAPLSLQRNPGTHSAPSRTAICSRAILIASCSFASSSRRGGRSVRYSATYIPLSSSRRSSTCS